MTAAKGCYATNAYLAKMLNTTPRRMANLISELRKKGFIEDISFDGRERRMRARTGFPKAVRTPKRVHGIDEGSIHKTSEGSVHRSGESSVHEIGDSSLLDREKRREKMREMPALTFSIPEVLNNLEFVEAWNAYVADRKERNKQLTTGAASALLKRLSEHPTKAPRVVYKMIESGWSTFEWNWEGVTCAVGPVVKKKASFKDYTPLSERLHELPPQLREPSRRIPPARPMKVGSA